MGFVSLSGNHSEVFSSNIFTELTSVRICAAPENWHVYTPIQSAKLRDRFMHHINEMASFGQIQAATGFSFMEMPNGMNKYLMTFFVALQIQSTTGGHSFKTLF